MTRLITILIIVAGLGYGGYFAWQKWQSQQQLGQKSDRPKTAPVETRDIHFYVSAAGEIGPAEQVSVRPEINGRIETLPVDIGDHVKKRSVLFTLDDKDLQIERTQRLTEIEGAKLQVAKAKRNYERSKQLFAEKLISQELYEDTKTEFDLAENSLQKAEKALTLLEESLTKTKIVAPFDCTILTRPVSVGQAVSGSGGFNSGTEVLTIANLKDMIINAHINQADVTRLTVNQEVEIQIDSVPGLRLVGVIDRVAPQATIKNGIKGFAARIALKDVDPRVRPGMTANVSIPVASAENVLAVPLAAVFTEQDGRYVYVQKSDGSFERRPVQIGVSDFFFAEVQKGLSGGEVIAIEPTDAMTETKPGKTPWERTGSGSSPAAPRPPKSAVPKLGESRSRQSPARGPANALSGNTVAR